MPYQLPPPLRTDTEQVPKPSQWAEALWMFPCLSRVEENQQKRPTFIDCVTC